MEAPIIVYSQGFEKLDALYLFDAAPSDDGAPVTPLTSVPEPARMLLSNDERAMLDKGTLAAYPDSITIVEGDTEETIGLLLREKYAVRQQEFVRSFKPRGKFVGKRFAAK